MKLQELESKTKIQQSLKVFESHFGQSLAIDAITTNQAQRMLSKVRGLIREHRSTSDFHRSEQNPSYLKLVVMERALEARVKESQPGAAPGMAMAQQDPAQQAADAQASAAATKRIATGTGQANKAGMVGKAIDSAIQGKTLTPAEKTMVGKTLSTVQQAAAKDSRLQQMLKTATTAESKKSQNRRLKEASELQQAQVVLAAQDMVDQIQKMIEQVSAMQFKDLPALVDSIRNDVGMDQAQQFNNDSTAALQGLIQNLQSSKQQLETAQSTMTGQEPVVPGQDPNAMPVPAVGDDSMTDQDADLSLDANLDIEADEIPAKALGRERR